MPTTPASLLEQLRKPGDQEAWALFAKLYTPLLFYWARRLGLQDADAENLVQEVFVVLVRKLPEFQYDQHKSFRAWLRTIIHHKWRDLIPNRPVPLPLNPDDDPPARPPDEVFEKEEYRRRLLARALELMERDFQPTTWKAFWGHGVLGHSAERVATELGITVGAVYSARFRVMDRLRKELKGLLD